MEKSFDLTSHPDKRRIRKVFLVKPLRAKERMLRKGKIRKLCLPFFVKKRLRGKERTRRRDYSNNDTATEYVTSIPDAILYVTFARNKFFHFFKLHTSLKSQAII